MTAYRRDDRDGRWAVDFTWIHPNGTRQRVRRVSPVDTKQGAEKYERQLRERLLDTGTIVDRTVLFGDFAQDYLKHLAATVRPATYRLAESIVRTHLVPAFGNLPFVSVGRRDVDSFRDSLVESGMKRSSVNVVLQRYNHMARLAVEWEVLESACLARALKQPSKDVPDFLSFEEAAIFLDRCDVRFRVAACLALKAGLRIGEILGLKWSDIDMKGARLVVRRSRSVDGEGSTKSGKSRTVDMPACLMDELRRTVRYICCDYVVADTDGTPAKRDAMTFWLSQELDRLKIFHPTRIGWHDLRHTYASHLAMKGVPLKVIQELLGHSSITMTMVYAHLSPETKRDAVRVLDDTASSPDVFGIV